MELSHVYRKGSGELILFLHGLGCSKESFADVWELKGFEKYSMLAVDLAGHGDSIRPPDFSYSMEDQAELCASLLSGIEYERLHIVAHSMGGAAGLILAGKSGKKLASFVSVEGNLTGADCGLVSRKSISYPLEQFLGGKFDKFIEANEKSEDRSLRLWAGMLRKCSPLAFHRSAESLVKWSDSGRLLKMFLGLECRKAYMYGERNSGMEVLGMLEGVERISVSGSGHFVMSDNPPEFYAKLLSFLNSRMKRPIYSMPEDVVKALSERGLVDSYEKRPAYQKNDYIGWIDRAKRPETRRKRLNQMLDELESGKEYMGMKYNANK